jgi:major membrane immunogen (membrane-anchored lipoprotein)
MTKTILVPALLASLLLAACAQKDPRVAAAEDFRNTAFGLIEQDQKRAEALASLRLGISDEQVIAKAGPPTTRESRRDADGTMVETWVYRGELKTLGTLTIEDQKLVQVQVY